MQDGNATNHPMRRLFSSRRGLLAGGAALAAAAAASVAEVRTVLAAPISGSSTSSAPAVEGSNTSSGGIGVRGYMTPHWGFGVMGLVGYSSPPAFVGLSCGVFGSNTTSGAGVQGESYTGDGVIGICQNQSATGNGVLGLTTNGAGVRGEVGTTASNPGSGVVGVASGCEFSNASNVGVGGSGRGDGFQANKTGVLGTTDGGVGVQGMAMGAGTGIQGSSNAGGGPDFNGSGIGVEGRSGSGTGVKGQSGQGYGVHGVSSVHGVRGESTGGGFGVFGTSAGNVAVYGESTGGQGVYGRSTNSPGAQGVSTNSFGVLGTSTNGPGVVGLTGNGAAGVYGQSTGPGPAAQFVGNVVVQGNLTVTGSFPKSAAVPHPDGTLRRMYCQEAPEPWFEDFGEATLTNGRAVVQLDPEFDAVIKGDNYQVFLTAYGDLGTLYVADRRPHRFEVRSDKGTDVAGSFGYRVVGRRRDLAPGRMEKVAVPKPVDIKSVKEVVVPTIPQSPSPRREDR